MRVGVFDSGLGGLAILREILRVRPALDLDYYADQRRIPWGPRPAADIRRYCQAITRRFQARGCERIVLACNTASAVALQELRSTHPELVFVGMEPAIKPAASLTRSGVVGLLATPATLNGELLAQTRAKHAAHIHIVSDPCAGLVEAIEAGDDRAVQLCLQQIVPRLCAAGADVLVLGCTHYAFAHADIVALAGPDVQVVDPAPAVAAQVARLTPADGPTRGARWLTTSGAADRFAARARQWLPGDWQVSHADWVDSAPL